ncbi:hypothetical protein [Bradyrhizobium sp. WSM471]|uniref:hypothetical protein n=1 Tax=Bradyrhizobium sp. WSM471 TaxID=319017 RepID=UPI00024D1A32|nr:MULTISPECIES: hypothetical protein [Bradyrhizobium]EHR00341.1 hypothetical protein Bra471DRAFT_00912 [Bradyrhizobium sp. WSM471]UFW42449.1 hypothetical protein BcanWSM471_04440 [Bradyrhizobium canariense]
MLMIKERARAIHTRRGWPSTVLYEAGAIRKCEAHSGIQDRADPHARKRAFDVAARNSPSGVPAHDAVAEVRDVLDSSGDTCPECPTELD